MIFYFNFSHTFRVRLRLRPICARRRRHSRRHRRESDCSGGGSVPNLREMRHAFCRDLKVTTCSHKRRRGPNEHGAMRENMRAHTHTHTRCVATAVFAIDQSVNDDVHIYEWKCERTNPSAGVDGIQMVRRGRRVWI